ncbi:MAG: SGNH/GDSL hydrolase family protein [Bacteroidia bacterium]|nr:SGNH/GDSL hydrolase family protein [Bacteroidia bacterium]
MKTGLLFTILISSMLLGCSTNTPSLAMDNSDPEQTDVREINILSLGDSYTIGQSVCASCKFPEQLKDSLISNLNDNSEFNLRIIAQTGWTTTDLKNRIAIENPSNTNDLVTLLIGVNNQFQGISFSVYETEFVDLVNTAITKAGGDKNRLIVLSIPDYAFTTFGQNYGNPIETSLEIDQYNDFAQAYCLQNDISYVYITDISRLGLDNPDLVATDNLHPSELAYSLFVERLLPIALEKIE